MTEEKYQKLGAAEARDGIARAYAALDARPHLCEQKVAARMAVEFIHAAEAIEIEPDDTERDVAGDAVLDDRFKARTIGEAGERIGLTLVFERGPMGMHESRNHNERDGERRSESDSHIILMLERKRAAANIHVGYLP